MNADYQRQGTVGAYADLVVGGPDNLDAADQIEWHVKRGHGALTEYDILEAEVMDADARIVRVKYGDADGWLATATVGTWYLQMWAHWPDESEFTWPEEPFDPPHIIVGERYLAPVPTP